MLHELRVRRLAVIEDMTVAFGPGLNVLTGETGAGKSILVTAIGLALGWRATADMIRTGCRDAEVEASFDSDHPTRVRRVIQAAGRNRMEIAGAAVTLAALQNLGESLINLYGQHEAQGLMRPETHLDLLDAYAGLTETRRDLSALFVKWKELDARLAELRRKEAEREAREGYLRFVVEEIEGARVRPGEDEQLAARRKVLANAEALVHLAREIGETLYEQEGSVAERAGVLLRQVENRIELDERLKIVAQHLRELVAVAEEANRWRRDYAEALEHDPAALGEIDERLSLLRDLKKMYGGSLEAVLTAARDAAVELATLEILSCEIADAENAREVTRIDLLAAARKLTAARKKAATKMEKEVERELGDLDMAGTRFVAPVEPLEEGGVMLDDTRLDAGGADGVEFLLSPNVGEHPRPLVRIASGGELSRVMLAIKRVLSRHFPVPTLIFDEVDSGVGGAQAERLGRKLQEVASEHQVLCITHLPQIAALADRHYVVRKAVSGGRTHTSVDLLDEAGRIEELARMLGGEQITDAARAAARALRAAGKRPSRQTRQ